MAQDHSANWDIPDFEWRGPDGSPSGIDGLRAASAKVWPRVLAFARKELTGKLAAGERKALTLEVWGDTLVSVAETLKRHRGKGAIRDLEGYLFGTFKHRLNRELIKEEKLSEVIESVGSTSEMERLDSVKDEDWEPNLEKDLLVQELLRRMDDWMRNVYMDLRFGFKWKDIAKRLGMTQQQVKMRFRRNFERLLREIEGENRGEEEPGDGNDET